MQPLAAARQLTIHRQVSRHVLAQADRIRLKQVLLNLLSNAIKYNRAGGDIDVRVSVTAQAKVRLEVTDSGIGIAQDRLKDVFQAFTPPGKGRTTVQGTGIGLSISRQLVLLMGGEVGVQSELGSGSTFWFELPAGSDEGAASVDEAPPIDTQWGEGGQQFSVLCVDDNPINLKLIAQILAKRPNIQLLTAPTPGLGIQLALGRQPDLILLDINMPGMDGYQVLDVLKTYERTKSIPIIAVTANATPRDIAQGGTVGLADYLTKPLDVGKFLATVDFWLEKSQTERA
jgi:CheY-like chemotaxis protein/anti-sigma regulatory factor (Ser/Thr protein kinase)